MTWVFTERTYYNTKRLEEKLWFENVHMRNHLM